MTQSKLTTTQPADLIERYRRTAAKQGKTLSAFVGDACNAACGIYVERKPVGRPKKAITKRAKR